MGSLSGRLACCLSIQLVQVGITIGVVVSSSSLELLINIAMDATVLGIIVNVAVDVLIASVSFGSRVYPVCVVLKQLAKKG